MVHVARAAFAEDRDEVGTESAAELLLEMHGEVGAVGVSAEGGDVHGEDAQHAEGPLRLRVGREDEVQVGIGGAGGADDVRVPLAGVEDHGTVLHVVAPVERQAGLANDPAREPRRDGPRVCPLDRLGALAGEEGRIVDGLVRVLAFRLHGLLVPEPVADVVIEDAAVRVRGTDRDVVGRNARLLAGQGAGPFSDLARHGGQVADHQRGPLTSLREHDGLGVQPVVNSGADVLIENCRPSACRPAG